jgi:hypothetical protein
MPTTARPATGAIRGAWREATDVRSWLCGIALTFLAAGASASELRLEVKYRSVETVYLAGGSADGLVVGDRLRILSRSEAIGEVEVVYLAEHSASCKVLRESRPVQAGDAAVIEKVAAAAPELSVVDVLPAAAPDTLPRAAASARSEPVPWARARGGVSLGWNKLWDHTENAFDFEQRTGRFDLGLWEIGGLPLQFSARARSRQDLRARPPGFEDIPSSERRDRIYEMAMRYEPQGGRFSLEAGRVGVTSLGIGYLDGAAGEMRLVGSLRLGGFFGNRADVERFSLFQSGRKYGGYLRFAGGGALWPGNYDVLVSGVRELAGSEVSREYLGYQGRLAARGFTFSQWLELDLLRGWRQGTDGQTTQLSNVSLSASYRMTPGSSLGLSYDQRRNYRTAETRTVPEIVFETFLHQGFRGSLDAARSGGIGASAFFGVRLQDQQADTAYSFGAGLRHPNLLSSRLSGSLDASGFTNGSTNGYQGSARIGRRAGAVTTDLAWGLSSYTFKSASGLRRLNQWLRLSARGEFAQGFWLYGEGEYARGDDVQGPRASLEIGYRF